MKPARKREMVDHVRTVWRVGIRRACRALPVDRSTYHYRSKQAGQAPLMKRIKEIAETRVRYGYRRIRIFLKRAGHAMSADRTHRLWRQAALQVPRRRPRRRVATGRPRPLPPAEAMSLELLLAPPTVSAL